MAGVGGRRGDRLRSHLQEIAVGGCDLFLNDLPADRGEIVAASPGAVKRRRVYLDVLAAFIITTTAADDRLFMTIGAADRVE